MSLLHWLAFWSATGLSGPPFNEDLPDGVVEVLTQAARVEIVTQVAQVDLVTAAARVERKVTS